jgi:pimeloyl-ACP methyl ester carboxylesterase
LFALTFAWALVQGCGYVRIAKTPMASLNVISREPCHAEGAIVLLPGFGDRASIFEERGFVAALRKVAPGYDVFAADAHFGYYRKGTVVERLEHDVIGPLRARGYTKLWLAGTSMGGHGAVGYAREHPESVEGLLLFAPYMGPESVLNEVRSAGGLCEYRTASVTPDDAQSFARMNLQWLKQEACDRKRIALWLAVGTEDHLLAADRVLGDALGAEHVLILPGGHGWKVWTPAATLLARRALAAKTETSSR